MNTHPPAIDLSTRFGDLGRAPGEPGTARARNLEATHTRGLEKARGHADALCTRVVEAGTR